MDCVSCACLADAAVKLLLLCCRYNYTKIQTAMAEKAAVAAASADVERQPILQMSANGMSSPDKAKHSPQAC